MLIRKLIISKPGLFGSKTIYCNKTLTVIYGNNGSGKSLLSKSIIELLGVNLNNPLIKSAGWDNFYLEIQAQNYLHNYELIRNGNKKFSIKYINDTSVETLFESPNSTVLFPSSREKMIDSLRHASDGGILSKFLSATDWQSFRAVSLIDAPTEMSFNGNADYRLFRQMLLDDDSKFYSTYLVIKDYYGEEAGSSGIHNSVLNTMLKFEGHIKDLDKNTQILNLQKSKKDKMLREMSRLESEINRFEQERTEILDDLDILRSVLKKFEAISSTEHKIKAISDKLEHADSLSGEIEKKEYLLKSKFKQFTNFDEKKKINLKKLQEIYRTIRDINAHLDELFSKNEKRTRRRHYISFFITLFFLGAMYIINISNSVPVKSTDIPFINITLALGTSTGIALMYLSLLLLGGRRDKKRLTSERVEAETRLHEILRENGVSLEDHRLEAVYEFLLQYFEEYGEYTEKQLELYVLKETLQSPEQIAELKNEKNECALDLRKLRVDSKKKIQDLVQLKIDILTEEHVNAMFTEAEHKFERTNGELKKKRQLLEQINNDILETDSHDGEYEALIKDRAAIQDKYNSLISHRNAMIYLLNMLEKVIKEREVRLFDRLIISTRNIFNKITGNQFVATVDDTTILNIMKHSRVPAEINGAQAHLLDLSMKMAFSEFLRERGLIFPLVVDDPFVFLDEKRSELLLDILNEIAQYRQVIVFSRHATHLKSGNAIEL